MSVLPIVLWPDPRLREVCAPVAEIDAALEQLIGDMFETMYDAPGRGLAAPQIGVMKRVFVMDATWKEGDMSPLACINPVIETAGAIESGAEACLSIPGVSVEVARPQSVTLKFTDLNGDLRVENLTGFAAICAQHEMDHLDGRAIFDHLDDAARAVLEANYARGAA